VVVTYGRRCPKGYLPAASVETEADAEELLRRCCETVYVRSEGRTGYVARELEREQTLDNLRAFGARLEAEYQKMLKDRSEGVSNE
jgi:hypothetical protein